MSAAPARPAVAPVKPGPVATWWIAIRPFSLPASTMPVLFATVAAVTVGGASLRPLLFALALLGVVLLHAGANLLNDAVDFEGGLDRQVHPGSGGVVRGWIAPSLARRAALACLGAGAAIGLGLVAVVGLPLLWIGLLGLAIGVLYSLGATSLKRHALGDLAVFLDFGVLGALGAWVVQTGTPSWVPVLWSVPIAILVSAILHANNWRDRASDRAHGVRTVAGVLTDRGAERYYAALLLAPFALILGLIALSLGGVLAPAMPWTFAVTLLALPRAWTLIRRSRDRQGTPPPVAFVALDAATGQLNLLFGALCIVALGLHALLSPWLAP